MIITLARLQYRPDCTPGKLAVNGVYSCVTIERPYNEGQNRHDTDCILEGVYRITIGFSPHFNRDMIRVNDVPGRDGILIHPANFVSQLLGCIAVGMRAAENPQGLAYIESSQEAYNPLFLQVKAALDAGETVTLEVHKPEAA